MHCELYRIVDGLIDWANRFASLSTVEQKWVMKFLFYLNRPSCRRKRCVSGRYRCSCRRCSMARWWWTWRWAAPSTSQRWTSWRAPAHRRCWAPRRRPPSSFKSRNRTPRAFTLRPSYARAPSRLKTGARSAWCIRRLPIRSSVAMSPTSISPFRAFKIRRPTIRRTGHKFISTTQRSKSWTFRIEFGHDLTRWRSPMARWNASQRNFSNSPHRNAWIFRTMACCRSRRMASIIWRDWKCSTYRTTICQRCPIWIAFKRISRWIYGTYAVDVLRLCEWWFRFFTCSGNAGMLCKSVLELIERGTVNFLDVEATFCLINQTFHWFNTTDMMPLRQLERIKQLNSECPRIPNVGNCTCEPEQMGYNVSGQHAQFTHARINGMICRVCRTAN